MSARLRHAVSLLPAAAVVAWIVVEWPVVQDGARRLGEADRGWLLLAAAGVPMSLVAAAMCTQGCVRERLPAGPLLAMQFAGSAAAHVLPSAVGSAAVTMRFLTRRGLSATRAACALAVNNAVGATVHMGLLLALLAFVPGVVDLPSTADGPARTVAIGMILGLVAVVAAVPPLRRLARATLAEARAVHVLPRRVAALWSGSLLLPTMHALTLVAVVRALDPTVPCGRVAAGYLAASAVSALVPTPGGFGALDAALGVALVAAGGTVELATSAVLGYRLVTVWLPLLPGGLVLGTLIRRRLL